MFQAQTVQLASSVVTEATRRGIKLATAESCTGGLVAGALTVIPGSSAVLDRGFVTYSNESKTDLVEVSADLLRAFGAVSPQVAGAMATGAVRRSNADWAVSTTGVAGPGGGSAEKPVGLVHFALFDGSALHHKVRRFGDLGRDDIRLASVDVALTMILQRLSAVGER